MPTDRQLWLLELAIGDYVKTGQPVSSASMIEKHGLKMSSATIRNDFAALEKDGYLEKGYKSSGRVPSNKGYEFYLNNIENNKDSIEHIKAKINTLFEQRKTNNEDMLKSVLKIVNEMTDTLSITHSVDVDKIIDLKTYDIGNDKALVIAVTSTGKVNNIELDLEGIDYSEFETVSKLIFKRVIGSQVDDIKERAKVIASLINKEISELEDRFKVVITNLVNKLAEREKVEYQGLSNVVKSDHISTKNQIKSIIDAVENNSIWELMGKSDNVKTTNSTIAIDFKDRKLDGVAAVDRKILHNGNQTRITLVGSKNQDYEKIFAALDYIEEKLKE